MLNQRRLAREWLVLLLGSVLLAALAVQGELTRKLDLSQLDLASSLASREPAPDIAIVGIDERSLARIGPWPWPRETHARLIDNLRKAGANVVLYDVLFIEPGAPEGDALLAEAIARHGKVVLPFSFLPVENRAEGIAPEYPLPALVDAAAATGHIGVVPDSDGAVRRFMLSVISEGQTFTHFVPAALTLADGKERKTALPPEGQWPVVPFNPPGSYTVIPAYSVLDGSVPAGFLKGRTIIVGATAAGMGDRHPVPSGGIGLMPGVELQANLLDALRSGRLIRELAPSWAVALAAFALVIQFAGLWKLPPRSGLMLSFGLLAGVWAASIALTLAAKVWIAPGPALLTVALAYPLWSWRRLTVVSAYLEEEADRLVATTGDTAKADGFDLVARQVNRLGQLVGEVSNALTFVRSTIEASPDAILVLDDQNAVMLGNRAASRLFSETPDPVGLTLADLYLNQCVTVDPEQAEIAMRDGRAFLFASAPLAGTLKKGRASRILAFRDISEIRRRQRENDELIEFLSHDMRSPQVAIMALAAELGADNAALASRIRSQAQLTLGLADGFVQLARVREVGADFESHDLAFLLQEAVDRCHAPAMAKGITLERDIPDDLVFADIDPGQISRMAGNLIGNAVKYTQYGGRVIISLALADPGEVQISVTDNGPGLPPERQRDPFTRFGSRSNSEGPSAGLGLAFVKRVVDAHHGRIEVRPNAGGGTVFDIRLPVTQPGAD
ncbi:MAG: CHASE2 domain-containing protein [Sphingomonadales bacterium]|nr:CHASE2 domain-containing protein [Sphingomonadales bacterium]